MLEYFCKYKCDKQSIEDNIINMVYAITKIKENGDDEDNKCDECECEEPTIQIDGDVCDICKVKDFFREIRDEL